MELHEFVRDTIASVINGVREAQKLAAKIGADVAPGDRMRGDGDGLSTIEFDVVVTASEEGRGQIGGSLKVAGLGFGGDKEKMQSASTANRIRFAVPVQLPAQGFTTREG